MAHFAYEEMIRLINLFQLDVRMQKTHDGKDAYLLTEKGQTNIIGEFKGNPSSGYVFDIYENNKTPQA